MKYKYLIILLLFVACQSTPDEHAHDNGHSHDAGGGHAVSHTDSRMTTDTTLRTDQTELFVEYPVLVVDQLSRFAAHFTWLENHQPVKEGSVTVSLIKGGQGIRHTVEQPTSPGIFTPALRPREAGIYKMVFELNSPGYQESITINRVKVYANAEEAAGLSEGPAAAGGNIEFLKEQAWKMDFQTRPVSRQVIYDVIKTSGSFQAAPETFRSLTASANGVVGFASENLTRGTKVDQGQLLMMVSSKGLASNNLETEIEKARANFEQAKAAYNRKKGLYASKIIPESEFEKVKNQYLVAKANFETLKNGYGAGGKQIRAPMNGYVKSLEIKNGAYVEQGEPLLTIGNDRSRLLEIQVSPSYAQSLSTIQNIWYQAGNNQWIGLNESGGFIQAIGKTVDRNNPLIPVYAKVTNEILIPEGGFTEVEIALGKKQESLTIPETALLEDYGNYSVMVQLSGETFERRQVTIGRKNGKYVEILEGLQEGQWVVTKGAYQVKMASMGESAGHGHAH